MAAGEMRAFMVSGDAKHRPATRFARLTMRVS